MCLDDGVGLALVRVDAEYLVDDGHTESSLDDDEPSIFSFLELLDDRIRRWIDDEIIVDLSVGVSEFFRPIDELMFTETDIRFLWCIIP